MFAPTVVEVDGKDEFEEEVDKVVENLLILFSRRRRRGFNRSCCRNPPSNIRSSRSGSRSHRAPGFGTAFRGVYAFGFWNGVRFRGGRSPAGQGRGLSFLDCFFCPGRI